MNRSMAYLFVAVGIWPSLKKVKDVVDQSALRLLHGATVSWQE